MILTRYNNKVKFPGYGNFKKHFSFAQILSDNEIGENLKHECISYVCSHPIKSKNDIEERCFSFFNSRKLIGTKYPKPQNDNPFIRIHGKDSLVSWVSQIVGLTHSHTSSMISTILYSSNRIIREGLLNKLLKLEAVNDSYFKEENCLKFFGVKKWSYRSKPTLRDAFIVNFNYIQWSFPNPITENIFKNQNSINTLPCRAGLTDEGGKLIFSHNLFDKYNVRKPTTFDARLHSQFEPGGYTKPLNKCKSLKGFPEFVHIPNNFKNLINFEAETFYKP